MLCALASIAISLRISPCPHQDVDHFSMAPTCCPMEWGEAIIVSRARISPCPHQDVGHLSMAFTCYPMEWGEAAIVPSIGINS